MCFRAAITPPLLRTPAHLWGGVGNRSRRVSLSGRVPGDASTPCSPPWGGHGYRPLISSPGLGSGRLSCTLGGPPEDASTSFMLDLAIRTVAVTAPFAWLLCRTPPASSRVPSSPHSCPSLGRAWGTVHAVFLSGRVPGDASTSFVLPLPVRAVASPVFFSAFNQIASRLISWHVSARLSPFGLFLRAILLGPDARIFSPPVAGQVSGRSERRRPRCRGK